MDTKGLKRKEIPVALSDKFSVVYGSVDKMNPEVLFLKGKTWINPTVKKDYTASAKFMEKRFKKQLSLALSKSPHFNSSFICDFNAKERTLRKGKSCQLTFELFFKQKDKIALLEELGETMTQTFTDVMTNLADTLKELDFTVSKRRS
jgi:hypothetical protein